MQFDPLILRRTDPLIPRLADPLIPRRTDPLIIKPIDHKAHSQIIAKFEHYNLSIYITPQTLR